MLFLFIVCSIPVCAIGWWWWADRRLRALPRRGLWRSALAAFVLLHAAGFLWLMGSRFLKAPGPPVPLLASTYIWSLVLLPCTVAATAGLAAAGAILRRMRGSAHDRSLVAAREPLAPHPGVPGSPVITRRRALAGFAMIGAPVVAQGAAVARGLSQMNHFRVREITVPHPDLPPALDGLTIAHVSDTHVGRFTRGKVLDAIAQRVCELDTDLVCFTGDLIDYTIADLPEALAMVRRFKARHGVYLCEGNHDLFEDRSRFRLLVRRSGVPLLVNETDTIEVRGQRVQLVGLRWGDTATNARGAFFERNLRQLAAQLDPGAFRILLSHHPHAFDDAAALGIPLTLAGHTHGGQLNFAEGVGLVRYAFRYMSGLYTKRTDTGHRSCVVSNGVGNWFPLRVNAPAEIVRITLRRANDSLGAG